MVDNPACVVDNATHIVNNAARMVLNAACMVHNLMYPVFKMMHGEGAAYGVQCRPGSPRQGGAACQMPPWEYVPGAVVAKLPAGMPGPAA
jgi:hypothetical protein